MDLDGKRLYLFRISSEGNCLAPFGGQTLDEKVFASLSF